MKPPFDIGKGLSISNIVNHDDSVCPSIISAGNRPKTLLPRRIPYLQLHSLTINL